MSLPAGPKLKVTKSLPVATDPISWLELVTGKQLYQWQKDELTILCAPVRPRVAYVQVPRKSGKSFLAAAFLLFEMCTKPQRHLYCVSDSERNLHSVIIRELRDLISGSEYLRDCIHVFKNHFECPQTGSFIEALPGNFASSQGKNPHAVVFDEVHLQKNGDTWSGFQMSGAARDDFLLFGITTPGYDLTSHAHDLYQQVKSGNSKIYGRVYEPVDPDCDIDDRVAWAQANPVLSETRGGFLAALEFDRGTLTESEFRRFRLGLWTATESHWLPYGVWDVLKSTEHSGKPEPGTKVWMGFDGSFSGDSTALVGCTADGYVWVEACWENPGRPGWRVPRHEVEDAIAMAMARYKVQELLCDPPYWGREISEWSVKWPKKVIEFPTFSRQRMAPACTQFYSGVMQKHITHDGDKRLARHISNAVVMASPQGDYITKADKMSPAKIDLAIAAVIAYSRASLAQKKRSPLFIG